MLKPTFKFLKTEQWTRCLFKSQKRLAPAWDLLSAPKYNRRFFYSSSSRCQESMNRIAIGQMCSSSSLDQNLGVVKTLIDQALASDAKVIFFPEAADYISRSASHSLELAEKSPAFVEGLQKAIPELCSKHQKRIDVSIGVHLPATSSDKSQHDTRLRNCLLYITHEGKIRQEYQKLHLFDVEVPNGPILKESQAVQPGRAIPDVLDTPVGKLGSAICFDVRFPELALKLRSKGAEILCFPSAFTMKTGEAHWQLLACARALDTQCYVIMPGQQGEHEVGIDPSKPGESPLKRVSWGHSMVVGPWGKVVAAADPANNEPQLLLADLDLDAQKKIRRDMPLWEQRRRDVFGDFV
ncbi:putative hydrolase [Lachancea thermotolerans CBS 6340]|uniref:KLTH0F05984p n=1 Tax=Lachancea thermotolerans (strain ATCC 56472 / CBS 6340 / NRRL Y-8284) TaxID=559295 RepID=C5DKM8_LACTC|nr:KLTH0F05984p [Lachancea thermotolerans CBS 6340]CAR24029.1 KLTH0F05984p [Lachancea thermotolerans CBS 6340]